MKNELQIFNNEEFGKVRVVEICDKPYFVGSDVAKALGYSNPQKAIRDHCKGVNETGIPTKGGIQNMKVIPEGDIYRLIVRSKLPSAEKFESWVFDEVLPSIRKHGAYMTEDTLEQAISNPDFAIGLLTKLKETQEENKLLKEDVKYKEDVIIGLVDDVDLAAKRQRLNQIIQKGFKNPRQQKDKWSLLYSEFEKKYHINLNMRMKSEEAISIKPKLKNKVDYIDRVMNKIPELYELACKIFHNDVDKLKEEWFEVVNS